MTMKEHVRNGLIEAIAEVVDYIEMKIIWGLIGFVVSAVIYALPL